MQPGVWGVWESVWEGVKGVNNAVFHMFADDSATGGGHLSNPSTPKTRSNPWSPAAQRRASKRRGEASKRKLRGELG